ncbi:MAG TPA: hypothetical protein VMM79_14285 [Longimicrobiales bacterium]|nr:hypothetical protein [Longimicrobiales bacterium]
MDITVYLPDELGLWAKSADVNLSRTLRDAVEALKVRAETLSEAAEIRLQLIDGDGRKFAGRFTGTLIAEGRDSAAYLTDDDRVLVHDWKNDSIIEIEDAEEELREWLPQDGYIEACASLGLEPVIDL